MRKQMLLPLDVADQERRRSLWKQLPEKSRTELVAMYARLIAKTARVPRPAQEEEQGDEPTDR